jgi:hypothetical protein
MCSVSISFYLWKSIFKRKAILCPERTGNQETGRKHTVRHMYVTGKSTKRKPYSCMTNRKAKERENTWD